MFFMTINALSSESADTIYEFLEYDEYSRKSLGLTCHSFHRVHTENQKYVKLAELVRQLYIIHATNVTDMPLWRVLKIVKVILAGESHNRSHHRKKFASLVHMIWELGLWALLTEGGGKMKQGSGQIRYIREEIAKTHESWETARECMNFVGTSMDITLIVTSRFLNLRDETDPEKILVNFDETISAFKYFSQESNLQLDAELKNMKKWLPFIHEDVRCMVQFKMERAMACLALSNSLLAFVDNEWEKIGKAIEENLQARDNDLVSKSAKNVKEGKRVIVNAGRYHVIIQENSPPVQFAAMKIPFLSLLPQEKEDKGSSNPTITARERLKGYNVLSAKEISWDVLHKFCALEPDRVLFEERESCLKEAQTLHALIKEFEHLFFPTQSGV